MPERENHPIPKLVEEFIRRHYFDQEAKTAINVISALRLSDALLSPCQLVAKMAGPERNGGDREKLKEVVYKVTTQIHMAIDKVAAGAKQDILIAFCYQLSRALILEFRNAAKDHMPDYMDCIEAGIREVAVIRSFDAGDRFEQLGLIRIRAMDQEEQALSQPSKIKVQPPKTHRKTPPARLVAGKLKVFMDKLGELMEEQYAILPDAWEWNRLFAGDLDPDIIVHVYRKKADRLVLLLYELYEKGFLAISGGTGRNGLAPIIVKTFVDEKGKTLVKKPKDMLAHRMGHRNKYKQVWRDVKAIVEELQQMEKQQNGRNEA